MKAYYRVVVGLLAAAFLMSAAAPAQALGKDFLFSRKFHGAIFLGFGGWLIKSAIDSKHDANKSYDLYKTAGTSAAALTYYDDSKRQDTRAAVYAVLGAGAILYSAHLFLKSDDDDLPAPKLQQGMINVKGVGLDVGADPVRGQMQVRLKTGF